MEKRLALGIETRQQMRRAHPPHGVDGFHETLLLGQHAHLVRGRRQRDADGESSVVMGLDFGFHAFVLNDGSTKVQV